MIKKNISLSDSLAALFSYKDAAQLFFHDMESYNILAKYAASDDRDAYLIGFWNSETGRLVIGPSGMLHVDLARQKAVTDHLSTGGGPWWGFTVFREDDLPGIQAMGYSSCTGDLMQQYYPGFRDSLKMALSGLFKEVMILQKNEQGKYQQEKLTF